MEVEDHVETVFPAPVYDLLYPVKTIREIAAFGIFDKIIVDRKAEVVKPPFADAGDIFFSYERIIVLLSVFTLREPAAEVDPVHISVY